MSVISVTNVSKSFKVFKERTATLKDRIVNNRKNKYDIYLALDNVSLEIPKGETVGLIGRNGSGKSTLLKLLTGILYPDQGTINIEGKVSSLLELGAGFHPDFTGRENIFMNAAILGLSKKEIKRKLDQIITFSELKHYIENPVRSYSSGMYMRLAFSVAIMVEPDILLIDEVLAVGDAAFQQKCMDQLLKLKNNGTTIVFVSHDLGAVEKLCDRVVWVNKGKIKEDGKPRKVIDKYLAYLSEEENQRLIEENNNFEKVSSENINEENEQQHANEQMDDKRWGNHQVEIVDVKIADEKGNSKLGFLSAEPMQIQISYEVNKDVEKPIFGCAIHTIDNTHCYGTNTFIDQFYIDHLDKSSKGKIIFNIPSINLVAGTYLLSVAAHDINGNQYDYHDKKYSFKISSLTNDVGIAKINHEWVHEK
ncbi:ABC transporter ATP-binding protein [Paenibacillus allorhizosphaerae]|uniref:Vitamin B12 import ATP-binding protein BtuD n=1 Tax=Paenibacillus allorhizosphaerae TaxID=2849866 RepID=A0ABM8VUX8_9BACL|nr:ABC transporter ATP-binding protein [Paenibacillus allorhizosphaerae]CAG7659139.1 Vitamin B12 import ATP-binding protein BtuD [Paenibacillus allorhizosphaerae]